ncbi:MAG: hypothetical protein WC777_02220 [Candidatus Gracilibacteria bacterium]|jgi:hypothetical protein
MFKKALPFLLALTLVGCQLIPTEPDPEAEPEEPEAPQEEEEEPTVDTSGLVAWEDSISAEVDFYEPVELPLSEIMDANESYYAENPLDDSDKGRKAWKIGTILKAPYAGQTLVLASPPYDGGGMGGDTAFRFAVDESTQEWTVLLNASENAYDGAWEDARSEIFPVVEEDTETRIQDLEVPDTLDLYEDTEVSLTNDLYMLAAQSFENPRSPITPLELNSSEFSHFYMIDNCLYALNKDGTLARYKLTPKIFNQLEVDEYLVGQAELSFTPNENAPKLNPETKNYALSVNSGCGFASGCIVQHFPTAEQEAELELAGDLDGEPVFWLAEPGDLDEESPFAIALSSAYYAYKARLQYDEGKSTEEPMAIESFAHSGDFFFIKLDTGTYTNVANAAYAPMAECGKPVIYLYPEEETLVSVRVDIPVFTKVEPFYGPRGWFVKAKPTGELWNIFDGKTYPYLFWEGQSDEEIILQDAGFTLAVSEVAKALPSLLVDMGLNAQETADFMEFWLPELQKVETPYIEFHFVGNALMDQVAPLHIYPQPDQVIRLFMFYEPAAEPGLPAPEYRAPDRYGFTVVEWGGSLY